MYAHAGKLYNELEGYKDSKVRYQECEYQVGKRAQARKDYTKAKKAFEQANGRKDSTTLLVQVQKKVLEKKEIGDKIKIGNSTWIILNKQLDKVLLIKKSALNNIVYSQFDKNNWEDSDVRSWLNGTYLDSEFTSEESANIVATKLIENDKESSDKISLLSEEELGDYIGVKLSCSRNQWLKNSVEGTRNALFLNKDGVVMKEGYPVDSNQFSVRPIFWYSIK